MHDARQPLKQKAGYKANGTAHIFSFPFARTGSKKQEEDTKQAPGPSQ
jgi:hypothetical protein